MLEKLLLGGALLASFVAACLRESSRVPTPSAPPSPPAPSRPVPKPRPQPPPWKPRGVPPRIWEIAQELSNRIAAITRLYDDALLALQRARVCIDRGDRRCVEEETARARRDCAGVIHQCELAVEIVKGVDPVAEELCREALSLARVACSLCSPSTYSEFSSYYPKIVHLIAEARQRILRRYL